MALCRLPAFAQEYLESGGEDEVTLRRNRDVFAEMEFVPRTLVDTSARSISTMLFGREQPSPIVVGPTGHNGIFWRDGDTALARAANEAGLPYVLSTLSNTRIEHLAQRTPGPLWMQLYIFEDRRLTDDILRRARGAGCDVLMLTTDSNVFGWREWDRRMYRAPGQLGPRSQIDALFHPRWLWNTMRNGVPPLANVIDHFPPDARTTRGSVMHVPRLFVPNIDWTTVDELRRDWPGRLVIKGILCPKDAQRAAERGCDGIVLSNHGGRHMDSCISPMDTLAEIAASVGDRMTVMVDSGFRRGSDIIKAMALGAKAVLVGRAALYGLAAGGQAGAARSIGLLHDEIDRVMGQLGRRDLEELDPGLLRR